MATIHVARDGAKLGEFSLEQIREGLRTGQFRPTDLGWEQGLPDWRPLATFVVEKPAAAAPSIEPVPGAAAVSPMTTPGATAGAGLPWEYRAQLGFVKAWFDTVSLLITKPSEAFTMMRPEGGLIDPLLFGLIGGCAGGIVSLLFQGLLKSIPGFAGRNDVLDYFGVGLWTIIIIYAVLMPVLVAIGLFVGGGILHLCLMMVGGANRSFETTFRVACFTAGSANLFSMIPFCGGIIALVYHIVLECIGLSRAHPTTTGKALLAIFLPMIVCCGLIVLLVVLLGGFGALMNRQH
jgi:hypothetical protein